MQKPPLFFLATHDSPSRGNLLASAWRNIHAHNPKEIIFLGHVDFFPRPRKVRDTTSRLEKRQAKIPPPVGLEN
jgi:hypothetical protein